MTCDSPEVSTWDVGACASMCIYSESDEGNSADDNGVGHCETNVDGSDKEADNNTGDSPM